MATNNLKALKSLIKTLESKDKKKEPRTYDPVKQAEGYEKRMEGSGIDVKEATDTRNPIEKALNLQEGQNALFDIFEIIGRPQQALFGGINAAQKGEDILEGARQGIAGEDFTHFGEILREGGMDDTPIFGENSGIFNKMGWDDVLGFAGDVLLDPVDIPLFGASKAVKIAGKTVNYMDALSDAAKATQVAQDAMKSTDVALQAATLANKADDVKKLTKDLDKVTETWNTLSKKYDAIKNMKRSRRTLLQVGTAYTGTGFRNMFRFADNQFMGLLEKLDARHMRMGAEQASKYGMSKLPKELGALKHYKDLKKSVVGIFDWTRKFGQAGIDLVGNSRRVRSKQQAVETSLQTLSSAWIKDTNGYKKLFIESAKKNGLYEKLYTSALDGRSLDDLAKNVYPHLKHASKRTELVDAVVMDYIDTLMMPIYEHGAEMFKVADGKVVAEVRGLNQKTSIAAMIDDDSLMYRMGLVPEQKQILETWIQENLPEWYEQYVTKESPLFMEPKMVTPNDKTVGTYRFNEGFAGKEEVGEKMASLRREIKRIEAISKVSVDDLQVPLSNHDLVVKQLEEVNGILDNHRALQKSKIPLKPADEVYVIPRTKTREAVNKHQAIIDKNRLRIADIQSEIAKLTGKKGKKKQLQALMDEGNNLALEIEKRTKSIDGIKAKALKAKSPDVANINDYKVTLENQAKALSDSLLSRLDDAKTGKSVRSVEGYRSTMKAAETMTEEMSIPVYLNQQTIDHITEFAQLDGVAEYLSATHHFFQDSVGIINEHLDASLDFQEGYMTHVMQEKWGKLNFPQFDTIGKRNPYLGSEYIGNSRKFATRKYQTSALAANDLVKGYTEWLRETGSIAADKVDDLLKTKNVEMFSTSLRTSVLDFMQKAPKNVGDAKLLREVMSDTIDAQLRGGEFMIPANSLTTPDTPRGYVKTTRQALESKLDAMKNIIDPEDRDEIINKISAWMKEQSPNHDVFYIDANINRLVGRISDKQETSAFLKTLEFVNNVFKQNKLLSPGFQLRNITGNMSNMNLAGMSVKEIGAYTKKAMNVLKKGDDLFAKSTKLGLDALTADELEMLKIYTEFAENGFQKMGNRIQDIPDYIKYADEKVRGKYSPMKLYDKVIAFNFKMNERGDSMYRMAAYMWAKDNGNKIMEMGFEAPEQFVRYALFDFADLSGVEQDVFRKLIPFYTFTKKNLAFQMKNIMRNPNRYNRLIKASNNMWSMMDLSPEEMDMYSIENFWIPIPHIGEDGKYYAIKASLPLGDLGEWISDPMRRMVSSVTPAARVPFELATNTQAFSGMPIQEFEGQKGFQIPELSRGVEYALSQTGLDVPLSLGMDVGRTAIQGFKGELDNPLESALGTVGRSMFSEKDPERTRTRNAYDKLDQLENLMRYYKQENVEIMTIADINNRDKKGRTQAILNNIRSLTKRGR